MFVTFAVYSRTVLLRVRRVLWMASQFPAFSLPLSAVPYDLVLLTACQRPHPLLKQPKFQALLFAQILELPVALGVRICGVLTFCKGFPKSG